MPIQQCKSHKQAMANQRLEEMLRAKHSKYRHFIDGYFNSIK